MSTTLHTPAQAPVSLGTHVPTASGNAASSLSESDPAGTFVPVSLVRQDTPERWANALKRAQDANVKVFELGRGRYAVTSAHDANKAYEVTVIPERCTCPAAMGGDPVCLHRAAVRAHLNPDPEPPAHQAYDPQEEALRWAENDLQRAYADLQRYSDRINRGDVLTEREWLAFELAQNREIDASDRIRELKAAKSASVAA